MIAPVEEVFGVIEPAGEHVGVERHLLLVQFGAPVGAGNLVQRGLDADLREAFLHQRAERLVDHRAKPRSNDSVVSKPLG